MAKKILCFVSDAIVSDEQNESLISAVRMLIRISGPLEGASIFINDTHSLSVIKEAYKSLALGSKNERVELQCLFSTFCVNIVDRCHSSRKSFADDGHLIDLLVNLSTVASISEISQYSAILLGVIMSDLPELRAVMFRSNHSLCGILHAAFDTMIGALTESSTKCSELLKQLGDFQLVYAQANSFGTVI